MARTQEDLNAIKEEVETLNEKLAELTDEELAQVSGGAFVCETQESQPQVRYQPPT